MTITTARYPTTPTVTRLKGTLLDTANVSDDFAWLDGEALFQSYNCMKFRAAAPFCAPAAKTFDQTAGWQDGFRFAVYGGAVCKAVGLDVEDMKSQVEAAFSAGESVGVERALMAQRFVVSTGNWPAPTDVTPAAGAVSIKAGLGILEGYAADNYTGLPTIHVPRAIGSIAASSTTIDVVGDRFYTKTGAKVAAGGGYDYPNNGPAGSAAAAGEKWIYATGEVVIGRSDLIVQEAMARDTNEVFVLGERGYIAAVDCFAAAIRVKVE